MNNPLVNQAAMVLPVFLLSACLGGGGSFDLDSVDTEAPRPAPKYQDVSSETPQARKDQGGYGFAMRLKRRNWHPRGNPKEDKIELSENDWEQTDNGDIKNPSKQKKIINDLLGNGGALLQDSSQEGQSISKVTDHHDFQYVWSGFFYKQIQTKFETTDGKMTARSGPDGYIFYKGKDPSRKLPVSGEVMYKGTWDFLTDVKTSQKFTDLGNTSTRPGDRYSAFSGELDYIVNKDSDKKDEHVGWGLTTEITVDFEKKTLSGKLIKNNRVNNDNDKHTTQYYSLDATLRGNRFNGKATATDKPKNDKTKEHPFVSDSSSLSGGFFGPQGEELGFRFLSNDQKVAVVGSAKTKDKAESGNGNGTSGGASVSASNGAADMPSENGKLTTVLDAVELKSGGKEVKNLDNFSNAAQLVVDGIMIPLLPQNSTGENNQPDQGKNGGTAFIYKTTYTPKNDDKDTKAQTGAAGSSGAQTDSGKADVNGGKAETKTYAVEVCCSNLNYLKYGLLTRKTAGNTVGSGNGSPTAAAQTDAQSMFLQGERTDEKEIPNDQNVVYRGSWYGHIANDTSWSGNASNATSGNRADFTVNFADKKITGKLTAENRQAATFTIEGDIKDNGFEGTAKTAELGFDLDQSNTTGTPKAYITNAKVQGGFYGPKAEELGGWFAYPGDKQTENTTVASGNGNSASSATVVFGAKRQKPVQ
ncbi:transferrin-binding protein 2 [Neisseria meningitidis]|uniref:transferrin-binding protein-like solute binding protein n=1 Tax=Neisseria meningitidis TaxID=487 RepID=UPI000766B0E2|nr:transferrin-binding protein-like solute binding protein [Neisseria meningitidis]RPC85839.1 transferrin-binding protein 2 [Neisseria meningitidis]CWN89285.1 transferrin-binding protein B [Neisseria meningitidis]CWR83191.1 transferrin-binding protein B [Neisseria meningitidis]